MMRLLEDIPAAAFQTVQHYLRGPDLAALRLVNRVICTRATSAPYIVLRITSSTTREDLRLWAQATRRLQDISTIHVHCSGKITQDTFDAALKLLSRRGRVSELHLVRAPGSTPTHSAAWSPHATMLPSLESLNHLQPHLKHLHISELALTDLAGDFAKITAAGRQLQSLVLHDVKWNKDGSTTLTAFAGAILQLPLSYPGLRQLHISMPTISPPSATAAPGWATAEQRMEAILEAAGLLPEHQAAALAVLAAASAQLKQLQSLTIVEAPGIWPLHTRRSHPSMAGDDFAAAAAATAAAAAATEGTQQLQLPPRGLHSMDTFGSWLLARLPQLQCLHISTRDATWGMTWQQQHGSGSLCSTKHLYGPAPVIQGTYHAFATGSDAAILRGSSDSVAQPVRKMPAPALVPDFARQLSGYSPRPVSLLLPQINKLHLSIQPQQLPGLQPLLASLPNLRHLKVALLLTSSQACDFAGLVAAAAAAGKGDLQSLVLLPGNSCVAVAGHMLLPLAACRNLKQLRLVGCFSAAGGDTVAAWGTLRQCTGLTELAIQQRGPDILQLPVTCLPAALQVLEGRRLHLTGSSSNSSSSCATSAMPELQSLQMHQCQLDDPLDLAGVKLQQLTTNASSWQGGWAAAAAAWPGLRRLTACCLSLHSTCDSSCNDAAAVMNAARSSSSTTSAADEFDNSARSTASSRPCGYRALGGFDEADADRALLATWAAEAGQAASVQLAQELVDGFQGLQSISVQHVPCIAPAVLQAMWQSPALQHLNLATTVVAGKWENLLCNVALASSTTGCSSDFSSSSSSSTSIKDGDGAGSQQHSNGCVHPCLKHLTLHVPHSTPSGQLLSPLFLATGQPSTTTAAAMTAHGVGGLSFQQALQQQLPWATVTVVHARSLPC